PEALRGFAAQRARTPRQGEYERDCARWWRRQGRSSRLRAPPVRRVNNDEEERTRSRGWTLESATLTLRICANPIAVRECATMSSVNDGCKHRHLTIYNSGRCPRFATQITLCGARSPQRGLAV